MWILHLEQNNFFLHLYNGRPLKVYHLSPKKKSEVFLDAYATHTNIHHERCKHISMFQLRRRQQQQQHAAKEIEIVIVTNNINLCGGFGSAGGLIVMLVILVVALVILRVVVVFS